MIQGIAVNPHPIKTTTHHTSYIIEFRQLVNDTRDILIMAGSSFGENVITH
jgi:hypothetical protein